MSKSAVKYSYYFFTMVYIGLAMLLAYGDEWLMASLALLCGIILFCLGWRISSVSLQLFDAYLEVRGHTFPYTQIKSITKSQSKAAQLRIFDFGILPKSWVYNINTEENTIEVFSQFCRDIDTLVTKVAERAHIKIVTC